MEAERGETSEILRKVARGDLSPEDAAALLADVGRREPAAVPATGHQAAARVRVIRSAGRAEIIGDTGVREVVVEGAHRIHRGGDTVVVEAVADEGSGGERSRRRRFAEGVGGHSDMIRVRMNPDLALQIEGQAGSVSIRNVRAPIVCDALAGSTSIEGFGSPIQVSLRAGSVRARGRLDHGHSRLSCEAGSILLHLEHGSSVRVAAPEAGPRVSVEGRQAGGVWVIGGGVGTLDLVARTGSIRVTAED
jgi:hypothetical protein